MSEYLDPYAETIFKRTYARWVDGEKRRETFEESVDRYVGFFQQYNQDNYGYTTSATDLLDAKQSILNLEVMPSMRAFMTAGPALSQVAMANYNCTAHGIDSVKAFCDLMYIMMCGAGSGFSVERRFTDKLPHVPREIIAGQEDILVEDSRIGWCDALFKQLTSLFNGVYRKFDISGVREEGARLKTFGGYASGGQVLIDLQNLVYGIFVEAQGRRLTPYECFSICTMIAQIVVVGGVRRSATICLFDLDDTQMLNAKVGEWYAKGSGREHFAMANISAVFEKKPTRAQFDAYWKALRDSFAGEPGIFNRAGVWKHLKANGRKIHYEDGSLIPFLANPCSLPADQMIMTADGPRRIGTLVGEQPDVVVNGKIYRTMTPFIKTGHKPVFTVSTDEGYEICGTDDHPVLVDGKGWVNIDKLEIGDKLVVSSRDGYVIHADRVEEDKGWLLGEIVGDGGFNPGAYPTYARFWPKDHEMIEHAHEIVEKNFRIRDVNTKSVTDLTVHKDKPYTVVMRGADHFFGKYITPLEKETLPALEEESDAFVKGFLQGYFDADGTVLDNTSKATREVRLSSTSYTRLQVVQRMLARFGIFCRLYKEREEAGLRSLPNGRGEAQDYVCQATHELVISGQDSAVFSELIGFRSNAKQDRLERAVSSYTRGPYKRKMHATVAGIELRGTEDVYDAQVEDVACFDCNGIIVHNCEIILRPKQACNLSGVAIRPDDDLESLEEKVRIATMLGTWQSGVNHFEYLDHEWHDNINEERLLGVCLSGFYDHAVLSETCANSKRMLETLRLNAIEWNKVFAKELGIPASASVTSVKPAGNSGELYGTASGIHPRHANNFVRTVRASRADPVARFLIDSGVPYEVSLQSDRDVVFAFPRQGPANAIIRDDVSALRQLNHWLHVKSHYTTHTVSATVSIRDNEWEHSADWVYDNFDEITGIAFLPYDGGTYAQAPFQTITEEEYHALAADFPVLDWNLMQYYEQIDTTSPSQEFTCVGDRCAITS